MDPERWRQIEELYHAALGRPPAERAALLLETCDDEALRREVASLLEKHEQTGDFLDRPAWERVLAASAAQQAEAAASPSPAPSAQTDTPTDLVGKQVGRFAVRARLGAGGMGEVYLAEDTVLKRRVALKRVPPALHSDPQYRQRLLKEAERASGLDHEHIAAIYDVLEADGDAFVVMEHVEGVTLRDRMREPLSIEEGVSLAAQCAEALAAAHEKGIVHYDIKPENIMLTPKGRVKILDFGIARHLPAPDRPTTSESTDEGRFRGTPAYMAPEALLGRAPDARADLFSLGVVLYEALAGRHPFLDETFAATTDRILHETPAPLGELNRQVPPELERIVSALLAKEPAGRYASAAALLADLRTLERGESPRPVVRRILSRWPVPAASAAVGILTLLVGLVVWESLPALKQSVRRQLRLVSVPEQKHVAVLPFAVLGGGGEESAFAGGLTETVSAGLTRLTERHSLQVVPASEVRSRGVTTFDQARREFGVNLVITGSLQFSGPTVRVNYVLADARSRRQIHADTITAAAHDSFAVEDRVLDGVLTALEISLHPGERTVMSEHGTREPAAFASYLRGRGYLQDYAKAENIESAIVAFSASLEKDPQYSLAHAGLGEAYWQKYLLTRDSEWVQPALEACQRAVSLKGGESAGHACLGVVYNGTGEYELAVQQFRRAVELEPTSDAAHRGLAAAYQRLGEPREAEETYRRAIALRPQYWAGYSWLGVFFYFQGRYSEAAEMFRKVVSLAPDNSRGYSNLCAAEAGLGRYAQAIEACERSAAIRPTGGAFSNLGTAYFYLRRFEEAAQAYQKAVTLEPKEYLWWGNLGEAQYWVPGKRAAATAAYGHAMLRAQEALAVNPRDSRALGYLGYYQASVGDERAALATLQRALSLDPDNPELRLNAALTYNKLGREDQALDWLTKALAAGLPPPVLRDNPFLDNLRADARFTELLQRHHP
jgi:serine/threonine-protein kinase